MPIPKWKKTPVPVPIETLRALAAKHGQDVTVLVTWHRDGVFNFTTVGSDFVYADAAVRMRDILAKNLGIESLGIDRDLRHEHPNVSLTKEQIDFVLWILGYMRGRAEKLDQKHRDYVLKYHDELLPIIAAATGKRKNEEKSLSAASGGPNPGGRRNRAPRRPRPPRKS